jgi:hypothetical protein
MTDSDKIVAAIFTAALCGSKQYLDHDTYLEHYARFITELEKQQEKPPLRVTPEMLAAAKAAKPRRRP